MSRVHNINKEDVVIEYDEFKFNRADNKLGTTISACHIASITESLADDQAVTNLEVVQAGAKDKEYLKKAIQEGFPEKEEECNPLIQPFHKFHLNISLVGQDKYKFLVFHDSDLRSRMVIPKILQN